MKRLSAAFWLFVATAAGAEEHWAYEAPVKATVAPSADVIDHFVRERLAEVGLEPTRPAGEAELIRRVTFDLTGLPPTVEEIDDFVADDSPGAYERVVDRLLASPRFGERWAAWWLDGARYGDSHGYDNDLENSQWPWRNWVIEAFNGNKPFDEFTVEQLAGDLLPVATEAQVLATAFNRNHRIQTEDGAIDEEWRTEYVMDRVETIATVWMAMTLNCARCHDHKYDPVSQREYYALFAFFNNVDEKGFINNLRGAAEPRIRYQGVAYQKEVDAISAHDGENEKREAAMRELDTRFPNVMIMREMPERRKTFVLDRGLYSATGDEVGRGLPSVLPQLAEGVELDRLAMARWLVNGDHPLTARVLVNRLWGQLFGVGMVKSSEDFGVRAEPPSHPELLDWLAVDLVENRWDVKRLLKQMVTSATYRQHHGVDPERLRIDPENRLLSRGPRVRLSAEMVRDQALAVSGLLVEKLGGPSLWVYQPEGLWKDVEKRGTFVQDRGEKLYRRSLYSRIRRTVAPPSMVLFDLPSREMCTVERPASNTPLQALALMNEVTYVEAARKFAERMLDSGADAGEQIAWGFRAATTRRAKPEELEVLGEGHARRLAVFKAEPARAGALLGFGESPPAERFDRVELAAMATVASVLLNLEEVLKR